MLLLDGIIFYEGKKWRLSLWSGKLKLLVAFNSNPRNSPVINFRQENFESAIYDITTFFGLATTDFFDSNIYILLRKLIKQAIYKTQQEILYFDCQKFHQ